MSTKKPTAAQRAALENLAAGRDATAHLSGMSAHGGFAGTRASLYRAGWITDDGITLAGVEAIAPTRPSIEGMRAIIAAFYKLPGNSGGGSLHIVLDDRNVEDCNVQHCREWAEERNDASGVNMAELLLKFTEGERAEMLGIASESEPESEDDEQAEDA